MFRRAGIGVLCASQSGGSGSIASGPCVQGVYRGLSPVVKFDVSPPLRDMQVILPDPGKLRENEDRDILPYKVRFAPEWDPVVQPTLGGARYRVELRFRGRSSASTAKPTPSGVVPPDPNGAVGPNHVVTMANLSFPDLQ